MAVPRVKEEKYILSCLLEKHREAWGGQILRVIRKIGICVKGSLWAREALKRVGAEGAWRLAWVKWTSRDGYQRHMLMGEPYVLWSELKEMTSFGIGKQFHKFLRNAGFSLTAGNSPPIVQAELISWHLNCLLEFGELEFPFNLILGNLHIVGVPHCLLI